MSGQNPPKNRRLFDHKDWLAFLVCCSAFGGWVYLLTSKYLHFGYYDWDLALYSQAMWNLAHGSLTSSLFGMSFLGNHGNYIAFLILPVYFFFQHPLTLIYLKLFSFFAGSFLLYRIARKELGWIISVVIMLLFILHPPNTYMLFFEFDFETLAVGLLVLAYMFYRQDRFIPFLLTAGAICLCKENLPALIAAWGVHALIFKKGERWKWGLSILGMGVAIFLIVIFILTPAFRQQLHEPANPYVQTFFVIPDITQPSPINIGIAYAKRYTERLLSTYNLDYLTDLFGAHSMTSIFSPQILFIALPLFLQNILGANSTMKMIFFQYNSSLLVFIFLATIHSLGWMRKQLSTAKYAIILTLFIGLSLYQIYFYRHIYPEKISDWLNTAQVPETWHLLDQIPKDAGVITTFSYLDALSGRKNLYTLYNVWLDKNLFTGDEPFTLPAPVRYGLIDLSDPWLASAVFKSDLAQTYTQNLRHFFFDTPWAVVRSYNDVVLLKRGGEGEPFIARSAEPFAEENDKKTINFNNYLQILKFNASYQSQITPQALSTKIIWQALDPTMHILYMRFFIKNSRDELIYQHTRRIGYTLYPTDAWQKDEYIKEIYNYAVPAFVPDDYSLYLMVTDGRRNPISLKVEGEDAQNEGNLIKIGILHVRP